MNCNKEIQQKSCCEPVMVWADASDYYTKQEVNQKLATLDAKNLDVEDFDAYSASTKDTIDAVSGDVISEHDRAVAAENALNDQIVSATSGMATQEWVESQGYLTEHQSLSGYATEQWVEDQGYLTEHQSLSGYATEEYVQDYTYEKAIIDSKDAEKLDISNFQTYSGTVASELSGKASQSLVDALSGTVADEIARATSAETALDDKIDALESGLTNDYYTKSETSSKTEIADAITSVDTKNLDVTEFTAYTANTDTRLDNVDYKVDTISGQVADIGVNCDLRLDVLEAWKISAGTDIANLQVGLVSKADASALTDVQTALQAKQDRLIAGDNITIVNNVISAVGGASGITSGQVESMIASATSGMATEQWVLDKNYITGVDLSNYALKSEIPTVPTSNTAFTNDAGYITSTALNGYATEAYVSGYTYDKATVDNKLADKLDATAYTPTDLSNYYTKNETSSKTEIADALAEKLALSDFQAYSGTVASELSRKASQSTVDTLSGQIQSISSSTSGDVTVISGDVITISGDVTSLSNDLSVHTANTSIHVTTAQTSAWDAKSDFSGSYNDLTDKPTIPTVPTSNTAFTNDAGYITSSALNGYAESTAVTQEISAAVSGKTNESDFSAHTANTSIHVTTAQTAAWDAKQNALTAGSGISITNNVISVTGGTEGITSAQCQVQIDQSISGKTNQSDFSAHTANTSIHVTTAQTAAWDAKSNFSGSYNDLTNKPTIPSIWSGTEAQWSQISGGTLDNNTIYLVY